MVTTVGEDGFGVMANGGGIVSSLERRVSLSKPCEQETNDIIF